MLKIKLSRQRDAMIVEGKLIALGLLNSPVPTKRQSRSSRRTDCDLSELNGNRPEGEEVLLPMMRGRGQFLSGVYMKEVLRQLGFRPRGMRMPPLKIRI